MKILVVCQYYYPEPFRITDICEELVRRGHEVTVISGIPNYPMGSVYPGYKSKDRKNEIINGVKIHRCATIARKSGAIFRFLNYYSYVISSNLYIRRFNEDFDVVFINQLSPVMMASCGLKYKKRHNKNALLYCLDLWPESLLAGGMKRESIVYRIFYNVSKSIYKEADFIYVTSEMFKEHLENEFGISEENMGYLPQYAEDLFLGSVTHNEDAQETNLLFAGNIGAAQDVKTILYAMNEIKTHKNINCHIVGDGSELDEIKSLSDELKLTQVFFHGRKELKDMPYYYSMADAMIVTLQDDEVLSMTLPGKVQSYMASERPIIGAINGETYRVVNSSGSGLCCHAGDYKSLSQIMLKMTNKQMCREMGIKAKEYYINHFSKEKFLNTLIEKLEELK